VTHDSTGPSARALPEPVYKAVERILDEHSAWIARPNTEVTRAVAFAAVVAAHKVLHEIAQQDQRDLSDIEARVRPTICQTWSSDGGDQGRQGRISEDDFDALVAIARTH
jgi:hypothetical protein